MPTVLSLYDYTGEAAKPWAAAGYDCVCFDIQHSKVNPRVERYQGGSIRFVHADLHDREVLAEIVKQYKGDAVFMMAFPVCTDMAVSGGTPLCRQRGRKPPIPSHCRRSRPLVRTCGRRPWMPLHDRKSSLRSGDTMARV